MTRYCVKCRKDFDFTIKSIKDMDNLVCPECGLKIDKNSRNPDLDKSEDRERTADAIGAAVSVMARINYIFYITVSLVACAAYFFHLDTLLYVMTGISLGVFFIQLFSQSLSFRTGLIFLPVGAAAGYFIFKSIQGACLGIAVVFIIRHLLRNLFFFIFNKLLSISDSGKK